MISTKGRYALRVIVDLAEHQQGEEYIPLKDIAARQEISEKYLEIILKVLVKEKLLKGLRGKGGGYRLTREPKDYPVGEILCLTEGTLAPVACLTEDAEPCGRAEGCSTLHMWQRFDTLVHDFFYTITVADLMDGGTQIK
ncbi:MAG: Rrf2 family transcriptional regulator [Lachnospiraceae bacterium]|nr:Rrf2 family transcriptional regulator [Lachnospiraceae bacterium]